MIAEGKKTIALLQGVDVVAFNVLSRIFCNSVLEPEDLYIQPQLLLELLPAPPTYNRKIILIP